MTSSIHIQQSLLNHLHQIYEEKNGLLTFADFMNFALYTPGLGYYSAGKIKIGSQGDFVTAPEISPLFSQCLAKHFSSFFDPDYSILELGAGTGRLASDLLKELNKQNTLPQKYYILEVSADLKALQQETLLKEMPGFYSHVEWLSALPSAFKGMILANEVIDALPVHLFKIDHDHAVLEGRVIFENQSWKLVYDKPLSNGFITAVQQLQSQLPTPLLPGYASEISLHLKPWINSLASCLQEGIMLFIDYGFPMHEYYHPARSTGTLMCHSRHRAHPDPMLNIGLQDLTAHVDFTALAQAGLAADLQLAGFTTQAAFLMGNQLLEIAQAQYSDNMIQNLQLSQQIQMLTAPHEMGELFKVMALSKNFTKTVPGFMRDHRHRL